MTVCGARTRTSGGECGRPAGWGTDHVGEGRCKLHGGSSHGRPMVHGRYSLAHRSSLAEKAQRFREDPAPGDLSEELVLMRALLQDFLDRYADGIPLPGDAIAAAYAMLGSITGTVERIFRILNQTALTQAEVQYLAARLGDALNTHVSDPELRSRILDATFGPPDPASSHALTNGRGDRRATWPERA